MLGFVTDPQDPEAQPPQYGPPPYEQPQYQQSPYPPPPYYPPPGQYPPPVYPAPYYPDPMAPYGRDPLSGEPLSDKSKVIAGLLQLLGLVGILGIGRIYLGQTGFGVVQLISGLLIGLVTCGIGLIVPVVWGIVDAVLILSGKVRDPRGRPLRDGT